MIRNSTNSEIKSAEKTRRPNDTAIKFDEILSRNDYFMAFMVHLSNEFSMELLLSLVEFIQFKQAIRAQQQIVGGGEDFSDIKLPDCVPESSIVHNEAHDFKTKA